MKSIAFVGTFVSLCPPLLVAKVPVWRGIKITEEYRCSPYKRSEHYPYSSSIENKIVKSMGNKIYCPYSGKFFNSIRETDIEHIVSLSEAHDSGLCSASTKTKRKFASDLRNLTLADPVINRREKRGYDASEWMPRYNRCWYAYKVIEIKKLYNLSIDPKELSVLKKTISKCRSMAMVFLKKSPVKYAQALSNDRTGPKAKKSKSGICHSIKSSPHYFRVKNFTSYTSLASCIKSGGRCPKRDFFLPIPKAKKEQGQRSDTGFQGCPHPPVIIILFTTGRNSREVLTRCKVTRQRTALSVAALGT